MDAQSVEVAKAVMDRFLNAQRSGQYIEYKYWLTRHHVTGSADVTTGLVSSGRQVNMYSGIQGSVGQGFARALTEADTWMRSGEAQVPGGTEFIADGVGCFVAPEAPPWISEPLLYYSFLTQRRHTTHYSYYMCALQAFGEFGIQSRAAATTAAATTINQRVNGGAGMMTLPINTRVALPSKQPIDFTWTLTQGFYATTDGNQLGGGNSLIPNAGAVVTGAEIGTNSREIVGTYGMALRGYQFSLPG